MMMKVTGGKQRTEKLYNEFIHFTLCTMYVILSIFFNKLHLISSYSLLLWTSLVKLTYVALEQFYFIIFHVFTAVKNP